MEYNFIHIIKHKSVYNLHKILFTYQYCWLFPISRQAIYLTRNLNILWLDWESAKEFPSIHLQKLMRYELEWKRKRLRVWVPEWEIQIFLSDAKINKFQHFNISPSFLSPLFKSSSKQSFILPYIVL